MLQPILASPPPFARALTFALRTGVDARPSLARLRETCTHERTVIGVGMPLVLSLGATVPGLRSFPPLVGAGCSFPSTQGALWAFVATGDGDLHQRATMIHTALGEAFVLTEEVSTFRHREGRDLTGYLDGTANPEGEAALRAAVVSGAGPGLDGGSFCAIQKYVHDTALFSRESHDARDRVIGRHHETNEELTGAPATAHIKRTEQESFDPPAFIVRRSMPWGTVTEHGLYFVAYGESLDWFERLLRRMAGLDDGVVDDLLRFTRATTGGYDFRPPLRDGRLDLSALSPG